MAKSERTAIAVRLPSLGRWRAPLFMLLAALALLAGATFLWQAWQTWQHARQGEETLAIRDQVLAGIGQKTTALRSRFEDLRRDEYVRADLEAGAFGDAASRIQSNWPSLRRVHAVDADLSQAYDGDKPAFDYGVLALLSAALISEDTQIGIVGRGSDLAVGVAGRIADAQRTLGVVYTELPLAELAGPLLDAAVAAGFIELRYGTTVVAQQGDPGLRSYAVPMPIAGSTLSLAAASPSGAGESQDLPVVDIGIGLVAWALAFALLWQARRGDTAPVSAAEPTLAEAIAADVEAKPRPAARAHAPTAAAAPQPAASLDRSIFRMYDIRGVVGTTLDSGVARLIGQAVGSLMRERGLREIIVGRDGRNTGQELAGGLIDGLRMAGCDVIDIGMAPTPVVYFATHHLATGTGIAITGSHNPAEYNGFKIMVGGTTLSGEALQELYARIAEGRLQEGGGGGLQTMQITHDYIERIASDVQLERRMRIVIDCGNGIAGAVAPQVLDAIGCDAEELYCDVDGSFPNHHPDPSEPENLRDLVTAVARTGAELGLAFDGDGDRLGVVTRQGEIIYPDRLLMLFAQDVLSRNPGAAIIYDVKCTGHLAGQILRHGGSPVMWKTGHSLIKAKMKETEAELAGEMSGHFFFRERWFGFDDGIYAAARLLEILAADERSPEEIFAELPKGVSTPELKVTMEEGEHYAFMERFRQQARFDGAKIVTIDGVRADWPDGWGLVRCSHTTPSLVLRFDADNGEALRRIQDAYREQLLAVHPGLALPF